MSISKSIIEKYIKKTVVEHPNSVSKSPVVSVCIQTFNHGKYIEECLESILNQETNFDFEILVGEDQSSDNTRDICIKYANAYPDKIKLFLHTRENNIKINGSPSGRFNFMYNLFSSKGKYIAMCEGDDYWLDSLKLQKQVDFLNSNNEYGICFHETNVYFQEKNKFKHNGTSKDIPETTTIVDLVKYNYIVTPSVLLRNDFDYPEWIVDLKIGDWPLYLGIIGDRKIKKLEDVMAVYRVHSKGMWSSSSELERLIINTNTVAKLLKEVDLPTSAKKTLKERYTKERKKLIKLKLKKFFRIKI